MKKIIICLLPIFLLLVACSSGSNSKSNIIGIEDLDKEKAKEAILDGAMEVDLHNSDDKGYEKSDIVNIEICESYQIDHSADGFTGNFISFWETSDGEKEYNFIINNDYEMENIGNHERIEDRCVSLD